MNGRPDRRANAAVRAGPLGTSSREYSLSLAISSTGTSTWRESCFFSPVLMMVTGRNRGVGCRVVVELVGCRLALVASPPRCPLHRGNCATSSSGFCVADSPIRCGGLSAQSRQPFERQRQMRAALVRDERVDLVDDDRLDAAQHLAHVRRQHQVDRLRRGDQDVGRIAKESRAFGLRRVAACGWRSTGARTLRRARRRGWRFRSAARAGCARRRRPALSAARCRRRGSGAPSADAARTSTGRAPRGTRSAFCRCRSGRRSASSRRGRWPASPSPAPCVGVSKDGREPVAHGRMKRLHRGIGRRVFVPLHDVSTCEPSAALDIKFLRCKNSLPPGDHRQRGEGQGCGSKCSARTARQTLNII